MFYNLVNSASPNDLMWLKISTMQFLPLDCSDASRLQDKGSFNVFVYTSLLHKKTKKHVWQNKEFLEFHSDLVRALGEKQGGRLVLHAWIFLLPLLGTGDQHSCSSGDRALSRMLWAVSRGSSCVLDRKPLDLGTTFIPLMFHRKCLADSCWPLWVLKMWTPHCVYWRQTHWKPAQPNVGFRKENDSNQSFP